jgi:hypothetical protein
MTDKPVEKIKVSLDEKRKEEAKHSHHHTEVQNEGETEKQLALKELVDHLIYVCFYGQQEYCMKYRDRIPNTSGMYFCESRCCWICRYNSKPSGMTPP